jgi:hypothetical protein
MDAAPFITTPAMAGKPVEWSHGDVDVTVTADGETAITARDEPQSVIYACCQHCPAHPHAAHADPCRQGCPA